MKSIYLIISFAFTFLSSCGKEEVTVAKMNHKLNLTLLLKIFFSIINKKKACNFHEIGRLFLSYLVSEDLLLPLELVIH